MPNMVIPGTSSATIQGSNYNISYSSKRDSVTVKRNCAFSYNISTSQGVSIGGYILNASRTTGSTWYVTTNSRVYSTISYVRNLR
ncbi:MAG: hypothetical protein ACK5LT_09060 [Lachnospirales bacterium]